ncbi:MAG TPA: hypothetical protein VFU81_15550 [Thermomicrobiales bacterium]|nr:hypothetical protein [Thermomicrobiales bacterium]
MATYFLTYAAVAGSVVLAVAVTVVVRRWLPARIADDFAAIGPSAATFGVLYSVILASTVVASWNRYEAANQLVLDEENALFNLVRLADAFPAADRALVRQHVADYGHAVIDTEWPAMARRDAPSPQAAAAIAGLYDVYARIDDPAVRADPAFVASLDALNQLDNARGGRLLQSDRSLPSGLWVALISGGMILLFFIFLLGTASRISHALIAAALVGFTALLLILIHDLDTPFQEPVAISPAALVRGMALLEQENHTIGSATPAASTGT